MTAPTTTATAPVFASSGFTLAHKSVLRARRAPTTATPRGGVWREHLTNTREHTSVQTKRGTGAATWSYSHVKGRHLIALGERFAECINVFPPRSSTPANMDRHAGRLGDRLLRHEFAHARYTSRDLGALASTCRASSVPFMLFNIFEDARIEALDRKRTGEPFGWSDFLRVDPKSTNPLTTFVACLAHEAGWPAYDFIGTPVERLAIDGFYVRATLAPTALDVIPICREWLDYWATTGRKAYDKPDTVMAPAGGSIGEESDGSDGGIVTAAGTPSASDAPARRPVHVPPDTMTLRTGTNGKRTDVVTGTDPAFFKGDREKSPVDPQAVARIAMRLDRIITAAASMHTARASTSGSRLHIAGIVAQSATAFRAPGKTGGKPRVVFLFDMSGSMSGDWQRHGRKFFYAIRTLVRNGTIDGRIFLTGGHRHAEITAITPDDVIRDLCPWHNSESVAATLEKVRPAVEAAHVTIVYTDARLTDGNVDAMRWRQRGADIMGACVIPAVYNEVVSAGLADEMRKHFGSFAAANTGEELATKLAGIIGERAKRGA